MEDKLEILLFIITNSLLSLCDPSFSRRSLYASKRQLCKHGCKATVRFPHTDGRESIFVKHMRKKEKKLCNMLREYLYLQDMPEKLYYLSLCSISTSIHRSIQHKHSSTKDNISLIFVLCLTSAPCCLVMIKHSTHASTSIVSLGSIASAIRFNTVSTLDNSAR